MPYATEHSLTTDVDISSLAFWSRPFAERDRAFERLRREAPVSWHTPLEVPGYGPEQHGEKGFWALVRAVDIAAVSRNSDDFSSEHGVGLAPSPLQISQLASFFLGMDPPRHTVYRRIISAAFTPRAVARLHEQIRTRACAIVDDLVGAGRIDFVERCAAVLPMQTICDLIGVPPSQQEEVRRAANLFVSESDPEERPKDVDAISFRLGLARYLHRVGAELAADRRKHPRDDLVTNLVQAEVDGHSLSDEEIGAFMILMSVAGNDTTKQTTSLAVMALAENPDQRAWLVEDLPGRLDGAIEEFIRHGTPVMTFARCAKRDLEIAGVPIEKGDKVGLLYCSGNRDESAFVDPHRFDLSRGRTMHVGFGGGGTHYCLGANIAKAQLRALFEQLLTRLPPLEVGEPEHLVSNFIRGVKRLPVDVGTRSA
jgi:cytochrome P450